MKKIFFTMLAAAFLIVFISCSSDSKSNKATDSDNVEPNDNDFIADVDEIKDADEAADADADETLDIEPDTDIVYTIEEDFAFVADWLTGRFSSEKQSKENVLYYDIRLFIHRIWKDRTDGVWMYLEQARSDYMESPYRQRVYNLFINEKNEIQNRNYEFKNPKPFVNAWKDMSIFDDFTPETLLNVVEGCDVYMKRVGDHFEGSTHEKDCKSDYNGASYATSEFKLFENKMESLDRGYDAEDNQVFGPTKDPYVFDKIEELP